MQPRLGRRRQVARRTRDAGVNRVSFGVQSMRRHVLVALGRTHDPDNVARAVDARARRGHRPRQPRPHLRHAGRDASPTGRPPSPPRSRSAPEHVSAYALTVEPGTPLGKAVAAGARAAPDDDDQAAEVRAGRRRAHRRGAAPGTRCRTGPARARSAATTSSTGQGGLRRDRLRRPRARPSPTGGAAVLERPHARALRRGGRAPGTVARGRARSGSTPASGPARRSILALRTAGRDQAPDAGGRSFPGGRLRRRLARRRPPRPARVIGVVLTRRGPAARQRGHRPGLARRARRRHAASARLALGRIECQWSSTSARPRSSGRSWRSTSPPPSRWGRRPSRAPASSACRAPRCATR